jgi:hypothetical protein
MIKMPASRWLAFLLLGSGLTLTTILELVLQTDRGAMQQEVLDSVMVKVRN